MIYIYAFCFLIRKVRHEACVFLSEGTIRFSSNKSNIQKLTRQMQRKVHLYFLYGSSPSQCLLHIAWIWLIIELHYVENKTKRSIARHLRISISQEQYLIDSTGSSLILIFLKVCLLLGSFITRSNILWIAITKRCGL